MSEQIKQMMTDMREIRAKTFVRSKQRLPKTEYEFYEWLLEFEAHNLAGIQEMCDAMTEYAKVKPVGPFIVPVERAKD